MKVAGEKMEIPFTNIGHLVDHAAVQYRDRLFWQSIDDDVSLTFAGLASDSVSVARALHGIGARKGDHIAVMMPSVPEFFIVWVAIARLGAVAVPINYQYTVAELEYVLKDSNTRFMVVEHERIGLIDELNAGGKALIPEDRIVLHGGSRKGMHDWTALLEAGRISDVEMPAVALDDLLTIQYTSGTTGFPKGCMLPHDYWLVLGAVRSGQFGLPRRLLVDKPLSYMGGIWRLLMCLFLGATGCVARRFTLSGMQQRIVDNEIDFFSVTDPVAKLPDHPGIAGMKFTCITASGLNKDAHLAIEKKYGAPVREMYGMTEIGSATYVRYDDAAMSGSGSCGKVAPLRECRVVGPDGKDVAPNVPGELWVRGRGLFKGYYNKEEATRAAFAGDWFRTGDVFRQDENGYFYILGRIKDSIRRSGENISSHEVAAAVTSHPGVLEVAVVGVPDAFRGEEVKAFILLQPGIDEKDVAPDRIIGHCEGLLAAFKVPRYLQYVPSLPRTSSGKIAINALKTEEAFTKGPVFDRTQNKWI